jgi:hydrogenase/urease accessory protein HupE
MAAHSKNPGALWRLLFALIMLAFPAAARAHSASTAYLRVTGQDADLAVQLSVPLRDLDYVIGLDTDGDGDITWGELRAHAAAIDAYALARLRLTADGALCLPGPVANLADVLNDGGYAVLRFSAHCPAPPLRLNVHYALLFDQDRLHRGLLYLNFGGSAHAASLSPDAPDAAFDLTPGLGETVRSFFLTGVNHLLTGIDHMLFVTMLLVPAMFRRGPNAGLQPVSSFRYAFIETLKVLSAFTLSHATTLTLSALHIVSIPERLSESGIALTILATAADNVWHFIPGRRWKLALVFGLVHGLGCATALGPLDLPPLQLAVALLSFNLGLEAAQVTIAALVLPLGFLARRTLFYPRVVMPGLSGAVGAVAMAWFIDRAWDFGFMPF